MQDFIEALVTLIEQMVSPPETLYEIYVRNVPYAHTTIWTVVGIGMSILCVFTYLFMLTTSNKGYELLSLILSPFLFLLNSGSFLLLGMLVFVLFCCGLLSLTTVPTDVWQALLMSYLLFGIMFGKGAFYFGAFRLGAWVGSTTKTGIVVFIAAFVISFLLNLSGLVSTLAAIILLLLSTFQIIYWSWSKVNHNPLIIPALVGLFLLVLVGGFVQSSFYYDSSPALDTNSPPSTPFWFVFDNFFFIVVMLGIGWAILATRINFQSTFNTRDLRNFFDR